MTWPALSNWVTVGHSSSWSTAYKTTDECLQKCAEKCADFSRPSTMINKYKATIEEANQIEYFKRKKYEQNNNLFCFFYYLHKHVLCGTTVRKLPKRNDKNRKQPFNHCLRHMPHRTYNHWAGCNIMPGHNIITGEMHNVCLKKHTLFRRYWNI